MPWDGGTDFTPGTKAFASLFNDRFAELAAYTDAIPLDDLANGPAGSLVVCNGSGVPQYVVPSTGGGSEATISSAGQITLKQKYRYHVHSAPPSGGTGAIPGLATTGLEAGTWLCFAKAELEAAGMGSGSVGTQFRIVKDNSTSVAFFKVSALPFSVAGMTGMGATFAPVTSAGGNTVQVYQDTASGAGLARGVLLAVKVQ